MNQFVTMALVAVALIALQYVLNRRNAGETRRVQNALMTDAKKRAWRTFSVSIVLTRRAETIFPLLDHLYSHKYKKLQIIVIVKQTAGTNAEKDLKNYRTLNKATGLKIVRYTAKQSVSDMLQKHASGQYVFELQPNDRLTKRFFEIASLPLAMQRHDAVAIRDIVLPEHTFAQTVAASGVLFRAIAASVAPRVLPSSQSIVRRVALRKSSIAVQVVPYQFGMYCGASKVATAKLGYLVITGVVVSILLAALVWLYFSIADPSLRFVVLGSSIATYLIVTMIIFFTIRGYRFIDWLNSVLFWPLFPFYVLGVLVYAGVTATTRSIVVARQK